MRILSLGAGVQSTTLLRMAESGEIERPDCAIFSDTGWEPRAVYDNLETLKAECSIPIITVSAGNLKEKALQSKDSKRFHSLPLHGERGLLPRMCTGDFKVKPIQNKIKELLGVSGRARLEPGTVELWIGISYDEIRRMKAADRKWIRHRWPLVEMRMNRSDCLAWMAENGFGVPPRSSCVGCPFHQDKEWHRMKTERPDDFRDAVQFDLDIRKVGSLKTEAYLHRSKQPLGEIDFEVDSGNQMIFEECEGFCNV